MDASGFFPNRVTSIKVIADEDEPLLQELIAEKNEFPDLKVILAVGGWAFSYALTPRFVMTFETERHNSEDDPTKDLFSLMISSSSTRAAFISSVQTALLAFGLDGIGTLGACLPLGLLSQMSSPFIRH